MDDDRILELTSNIEKTLGKENFATISDTIGEILEYLGISYSGLFSQVEYFISGEYAGVCYDDSLQPIYYTSSDFNKSEYDLKELKRTLITLRKNKYYDITDAQRSVLLTDLTRYPSIFIKEVNQHIR